MNRKIASTAFRPHSSGAGWASVAAMLSCLAGAALAQGPGDTQPLTGVHPGYTLVNLRPAALQEGIGGMDFLPDGRLAVCTWGGKRDPVGAPLRKGRVYILSGVDQDDPAQVTYKLYAANLQEPLGLKAVGDTLYVCERQALIELVDANKDGRADSSAAYASTAGYRPVAKYASGTVRHEFFFGLLHKAGVFYGAHSLAIPTSGTAVPQPHANRGTFLKVNRSSGATEYFAGGARTPFGLGWGPEGELFATDIQGTWMPASKLNHVKPGRFYGHYQPRQKPANKWDTLPYQKPAVYLPQSEIAAGPGQPVLVPSGPFAGQMLYPDMRYGGIQRVYLEKVAGEWQGAVFRFSAGFEGGLARMVYGPDGALYVGAVGYEESVWYEPGKKMYGLAKLKANGKSAFEMLRVISRAKGMEIEFTQPVGDSFTVPAKYTVNTFYYTPDSAYGGPKQGLKTLVPKSVKVDPTGHRVFLELDGLQANRVVYIRLRGLKSKAGAALWSTETWYTLNAIGAGEPFETPTAVSRSGIPEPLALTLAGDRLSVALPGEGAFVIRLVDALGVVRASWSGRGAPGSRAEVSTAGLPRGLYALRLAGAGLARVQAVALP